MAAEPIHAPFTWRVRVYWEDTDAGGVVYHAAYLRFLERARSEWLRAAGIDQSRLASEQRLLFAVTEADLRFLAPARLDDELQVSCVVERVGGASLRFSQDAVRLADNRHVLSARVRAACLAAGTFRPRPVPSHLLALAEPSR
ncbi:MAG: tol-pal system-associated acyl-CoA thioesterase [Pseudomonadota bacterium]